MENDRKLWKPMSKGESSKNIKNWVERCVFSAYKSRFWVVATIHGGAVSVFSVDVFIPRTEHDLTCLSMVGPRWMLEVLEFLGFTIWL